MDLIMLISTVVASVISSFVALFVSFYLNRRKELTQLDLQLENLNRLTIEYPYLGNKTFIDSWNPELIDDDKYQRYEVYCYTTMNYFYDVCEWFNYNEKKIEKYVAVKSWIRKHKKWWNQPSVEHDNKDVYGEKFSKYVDKYL